MENLTFEAVRTNVALREKLMRDARRARSAAVRNYLSALFNVFSRLLQRPARAPGRVRLNAALSEHGRRDDTKRGAALRFVARDDVIH
jgi:hypothetical protein